MSFKSFNFHKLRIFHILRNSRIFRNLRIFPVKKEIKPANDTAKLGPNLDFATSEAYNLLRTNILFSFPDRQEGVGKIIGVTSSLPQEGKSFNSINLCYSMAEAGYKVVLIDADLRRPSLATKLSLPLSPGLSNFLINNNKNVVHKGVLHENMAVVTAGDVPPNPSELLGSEKMHKMLGLFAQNFDFIVIDLPPVVSVSDPLVISKWIDGFVVVCRRSFTGRSYLKEAIRLLRFSEVRILGFVFNSYGEAKTGYYRYKGYSYYKKGYKGYYDSYSRSRGKKNDAPEK